MVGKDVDCALAFGAGNVGGGAGGKVDAAHRAPTLEQRAATLARDLRDPDGCPIGPKPDRAAESPVAGVRRDLRDARGADDIAHEVELLLKMGA